MTKKTISFSMSKKTLIKGRMINKGMRKDSTIT